MGILNIPPEWPTVRVPASVTSIGLPVIHLSYLYRNVEYLSVLLVYIGIPVIYLSYTYRIPVE